MSDKKTTVALLAKTAKYIESLKGRDKITKIVQYGSRAIKHYLLASDPKSDWGQRFDGLASATGTGRKLFRMGKTLNEIETLKGLLKKGDEGNTTKYVLSLVKTVSFGTYWFLDNISFLIRAKFSKADKKQIGLYGGYAWFLANISALLITVLDYLKASNKLTKKTSELRKAEGDKKDTAELVKEVAELTVKRQKATEDIIRYWCDCVVSSHAAEVPQMVGMSPLHDGQLGFLGVISAGINACQIWRDMDGGKDK